MERCGERGTDCFSGVGLVERMAVAMARGPRYEPLGGAPFTGRASAWSGMSTKG